MTKPTTVAEAMRALSETFAPTKPEPVEVKVVNDKLTPAESAQFLLTVILALPLRALAVWGFLAIFFPAFGATYIMVLVGLWAVAHVLPPNGERLAKSIISRRA